MPDVNKTFDTTDLGAQKYPGIRMYVEAPEVTIKRRLRLAIVVVSAVVTCAAILMLISSYKIKNLSKELFSAHALISQTNLNNSLDASLDKNWQEVAPYTEEINNALPLPSNLLVYQNALEQAATANNVQISVTFSSQGKSTSGSQSKDPATVNHQVTVKGSKDNIYSFVQAIESLSFYVQLNTFSLSFENDQNSSATLGLKIYTESSQSTPQNIPSGSKE